jgi:hypothetical protein
MTGAPARSTTDPRALDPQARQEAPTSLLDIIGARA